MVHVRSTESSLRRRAMRRFATSSTRTQYIVIEIPCERIRTTADKCVQTSAEPSVPRILTTADKCVQTSAEPSVPIGTISQQDLSDVIQETAQQTHDLLREKFDRRMEQVLHIAERAQTENQTLKAQLESLLSSLAETEGGGGMCAPSPDTPTQVECESANHAGETGPASFVDEATHLPSGQPDSQVLWTSDMRGGPGSWIDSCSDSNDSDDDSGSYWS